jgi:hypothetical protein
VRDVRTIHGNHGANAPGDNRHRLTLRHISRVDIALDPDQAHLPPTPSANRPPQGASAPGQTARFKPSRIDPLNREPAANPGSTAPFKPFRIDPLNREPTAKAGPPAPSVAGSNAFSAAATAQPARALHPIALTVIAAAGDAGARLVFDTQGGPSMIGAEHAPR